MDAAAQGLAPPPPPPPPPSLTLFSAPTTMATPAPPRLTVEVVQPEDHDKPAAIRPVVVARLSDPTCAKQTQP